jgi:hypothetical protein
MDRYGFKILYRTGGAREDMVVRKTLGKTTDFGKEIFSASLITDTTPAAVEERIVLVKEECRQTEHLSLSCTLFSSC